MELFESKDLQTPESNTPLTHLQVGEHRFPGVPFKSPLSHSSPNSGCVRLSPQPTGTTPSGDDIGYSRRAIGKCLLT